MRHRNILRKVSHAKFPLMAELDDTIRKNNLFFRQLLFLSVLILMGVVMLRELSFIIGSFLGAITLYIVFRPLQYRLIDRYRWRPWLASLLLVFLALLVLAGLLLEVVQLIVEVVHGQGDAIGMYSPFRFVNDKIKVVFHPKPPGTIF